MILVQIHVILVVPFSGLKARGPWSTQLFDTRWAWVGQVDLFLTSIGPKMLHLGFKITVKVLGYGYLEETSVMARFSVLLKGNFDLCSRLLRSGLPMNFKEN